MIITGNPTEKQIERIKSFYNLNHVVRSWKPGDPVCSFSLMFTDIGYPISNTLENVLDYIENYKYHANDSVTVTGSLKELPKYSVHTVQDVALGKVMICGIWVTVDNISPVRY